VLGVLGGAAFAPWLTAGATGAKAPTGRWTSSFIRLDPVEQFRQTLRLQRSLKDADDILHWYHFMMFAVPADSPTVPVVRWEGIELSRHELIGENRYLMHGHNLSYPRDLHTGEFVDRILNPLTGQRIPIGPMRLTEDPGLIRSPEGTLTLDRLGQPPRQDYRVLRREGGYVKIDTIRVPPATWPTPFIEGGFEGTPAELFDDPSLLWLPTQVSGAYVFPWPEWMQMGKAPGHMLGIWSGHKLRSVDELPDEFRLRAEREDAPLLSVDRRPFARK
jgi:hypothetical protein